MLRSFMVAIIALVLATNVKAKVEHAQFLSETWCWSPRSDIRGDCIYSLRQCQEIVRLRRAGVCHRP